MTVHPALPRILRIAGGFGLLAATAWLVGPQRMIGALARADAGALAAALALAVASNLASAWRWGLIARALGLRAPTSALVAMYARGMTSNILLPGATVSGDMLRSLQLSRLGNPLLESGVSVAFDRFSGLWTLCVLSFLAAGLAWATGLSLGEGDALSHYGLALGLVVIAPLLPWPVEWLERLPWAPARRLAALWARFRDPGSGLRHRLLATLPASLLVQLLSAAALAGCASAVGLRLPLPLVFAAAAPVFVMAALPLGVAGFGTRELAAVAVLGLAGAGPETAFATGLLYGVLGVLQGIAAAPLFLLRR